LKKTIILGSPIAESKQYRSHKMMDGFIGELETARQVCVVMQKSTFELNQPTDPL